ncbi:RimK/LysX family protein [Guyparkeria hydrothermalis]|uniref:ATP-dependent zinc protease family protein n=1 Tax=Guyparkeria hydrothermalis TaxID=923 RepID=UPI0020205B6A|nr:RimK/LysX family protein [Guyparkeria hydrothermalis]MCL7745431.1 RimK/LysX family protein [Guyparkeria hydrothermalis]
MHAVKLLTRTGHLLTAALLTFSFVAPVQADDKEIFGYVEDVKVMELGWIMEAKLDTGATTSSIDAREIETFEKDDEEWVRFKVVDRDTGTEAWLEREVERTVKIKRHEGKPDTRYVVNLTICVDSTEIEEEVTLNNRDGFNYPVLVGRNHMAGRIIVDPEERFTDDPDCK